MYVWNGDDNTHNTKQRGRGVASWLVCVVEELMGPLGWGYEEMYLHYDRDDPITTGKIIIKVVVIGSSEVVLLRRGLLYYQPLFSCQKSSKGIGGMAAGGGGSGWLRES